MEKSSTYHIIWHSRKQVETYVFNRNRDIKIGEFARTTNGKASSEIERPIFIQITNFYYKAAYLVWKIVT